MKVWTGRLFKCCERIATKFFSIAEHLPGINDDEVLKISRMRQCILITQDKDFGELIYRLGKAHEGVVLLRLAGINPHQKARLTLDVINKYQDELGRAFTVIYKNFVKIRKHD